ncbi:MAG TPA: Uma2 family endonuclease [Humisphaera sp.]
MTLLDLPIPKTRKRRPPRAAGQPRRRRPVAVRPRPKVRLTVDQYHRMIKLGVLEEGVPIELLDGQLVWKDRSASGADPMTVGDQHTWVIEAANDLNPKFNRQGCYARIQQPVTLPPHHEPEPDVLIVRGSRTDYAGRKPSPADVLCVIEVADSSLARDRGRKLKIYANAGLPLYVIFNLPDRSAEVYEEPVVGRGRYARSTTFSLRDKLTFPTAKGKGVTVTVKSLMPPDAG